ncbi:hypothetical protein JOQ06_001299 [Pogonophryne albipinna]|uniref:Uncharacterized protein n=1 Tax=Pogonophryne albipinna TaxID=1090488 RepID=A0AAD6B6T4_9TELE|nr:hypothetical protein JOQ06_001299 [Pogonophryne albipinna]
MEQEKLQKGTPLVPQRPTDAELGQTQYRKRGAATTNTEANGNSIQTPVVPPRPTEKSQPEVTKEETAIKQTDQSVLTGMFRRSQKEKPPSFTAGLKGVMKGLQIKSSPKVSREPSPEPRSEEAGSEKEETNKPERNAEAKQDIGDKIAGMFRKTPKEKSSSPAVTEKGGFFSGIHRKSHKTTDETPAQDSLSVHSDLSASSDSLSENSNKDRQSLHDDLSGSSDNLSEKSKEKGGFFSGMLRKSPKVSREGTPGQGSETLHCELSASSDSLSENKEKGGLFSGLLRKTPKTPGEENLSAQKDLSASNDSLSEATNTKVKGGFSGLFKRSSTLEDSAAAEEETESDDELTGSSEALNTKEKGGIFSGIFKKTPKSAEAAQPEEDESPDSDLSASTDNLSGNKQEKGGKLFGVLLKKTPKASGVKAETLEGEAEKELSARNDDLSENNTPKEKNIFSNMFKKPQKPAEGAAADKDELLDSDLSASTENISGNKQEKGGKLFGVLLKKTPKASGVKAETLEGEAEKELSASNDDLSENNTPKEKNIFSNMFKKPQKPAEGAAADKELEVNTEKLLSGSCENLEDTPAPKEKKGGLAGIFKRSGSIDNLFDEEKGGLFGGLLKKTPKASGDEATAEDKDDQKELSASNDSLFENNNTKEKNIFSNMFKKPQKPAEGAAADKELEVNTEKLLSGSCENLEDTPAPKEKKGGLAGIFKRSGSIDNLFDEEKGGLFGGLLKKTPKASGDEATAEDKDDQKELSASNDSLFENNNTKEKNIFSGMFKKTLKPSEGTTTDEELNEDTKLSNSCENLLEANKAKEKTGGLAGIFKKSPKPSPCAVAEKDPIKDTSDLYGSCDSLPGYGEDDLSALGELSNSNDNLIETTKEKKGGFAGIFRRTPKTIEQQDSENLEAPTGGIGLRRRKTIKRKKRVVSFRVKTTRPKMSRLNLQGSDKMADIQEVVEMQDLNPAQDSTVDVQNVEMAAYPTGENPLETELESDELTQWWNTVKGWAEWNENSNLQEEDEEMMMEQAADRVYMAARLFVRLFNKRGASLQHRILELMALADAADEFHKKTVQAAVGGGVASVAGSIATITGLILAPFTMGASIIVTAVGIAVATAGSITSATANITDTVHSNMDRKNLEKRIQGYQEEIKDIRECMEFVQAGMATLQEWDFEKYAQSAAKKAMNHNLKHVMKEGGRAGKALMINTDKLISTVQVLGVAGGAAKAAQAISITTGVMSGLFLALDVFFLAKDSHELRKGAKTKFATKIRDVCKELQDGLLDLNKVKTQLQKTMDGIEVEEFEEIVEVEEEVEDDLESDPKKLAELEQELDLMEEKMDKKVEEQKKIKEVNKEKKEEKSVNEKGEGLKNKEEIEEEMRKRDAMMEKESTKGKGDGESKMEKISAEAKEQKLESVKATKEEVLKEQSQKGKKKDKEVENRITAGKEKHESKRDQTREDKSANKKTEEKNKAGKEQEEMKGRSGDSKYSERVNPERESQRSSRETGESGRSDKDRSHRSERGSKHETLDIDKERKQSERSESWRRKGEEERGGKDWRAEGGESERGTRREEHGNVRKESHRSQEGVSRREGGGSREERRGGKETPHDEERVRRFERAGGEEGGEGTRRGSERASERARGSRPRSKAMLEDGLNI